MTLEQITLLLAVQGNGFIKALTTQTVKVGKMSHDKMLTVEETKNNINALIKWIYGALFNWIVSKVNKVCICMYMYIYVCVYVYIFMHMYIYVCTYF